MKQAELARLVGVTQARISQIEAGKGGGCPTHLWFALGEALDLPIRFEFGRDPLAELEDAGHLDLQEFMLELAHNTGRRRSFEFQPQASSGFSIDVAVRDDLTRSLVLQECWNTFGNLGAAVRSTRRKMAQLEEIGVAIGGEQGAYRVAACWVVRDVQRNRNVLAKYPEIFASTFTASSMAWISSLTSATQPPVAMGIVWCDPRRRRLTQVRF